MNARADAIILQQAASSSSKASSKTSKTSSTMDTPAHGNIAMFIGKEYQTLKACFEDKAYKMVRDAKGSVVQGPRIATKSKSISRATWNERVYILSCSSTGDAKTGLPPQHFKTKYAKQLYNLKAFRVQKSGNPAEPNILYHENKNGQSTIVVHVGQVFDIIMSNHTHQGVATTKLKINS